MKRPAGSTPKGSATVKHDFDTSRQRIQTFRHCAVANYVSRGDQTGRSPGHGSLVARHVSLVLVSHVADSTPVEAYAHMGHMSDYILARSGATKYHSFIR